MRVALAVALFVVAFVFGHSTTVLASETVPWGGFNESVLNASGTKTWTVSLTKEQMAGT